MRLFLAVLPVLPVLVLAACEKPVAPAPEPPVAEAPLPVAAPEVFTWVCPSGKSFKVSFDAGFTVATVTTDKATYNLPAAISASGSRYTDEKVEFWEHHGEAMLNGVAGESYEGCKPADPA